jgi:Ala-tRNA(Pro) deacylase
MISTRLKQYLDENQVGYDVMQHAPAFTAQQQAAHLHVPGREFVKVVVVKLGDNYALAVLPAPLRINFKALAQAAGAKRGQLASESEFQQLFPDCELGAMPPFGNLYNLPTYADESLRQDENLVFNAGTHAEAIRLRYSDFSRLARPRVLRFGEPPPEEVRAKKRAARVRGKKKAKAKPKKKAKAAKKAKARQKRQKRQKRQRKPFSRSRGIRVYASLRQRKQRKQRKIRKAGKRLR